MTARAWLSLGVVLILLAGCAPAVVPTPFATFAPQVPSPLPLPPSPTASPMPPTATPLPTWTPVPTPYPGAIYVDTDKELGPIRPLSYGTNYGPWSHIPLDSQQAFLDSGLSFIRFPGGNWGDEHDLDTTQIDQFIALTRSIHAEPQISVRLLGGDPGKAAAIIHYTLEKGYAVKYWSIGNEPNLYSFGPDKTFTIARFNSEWRAIAAVLRAADPTIKLIGPEISQFYPGPAFGLPDEAARQFLTEFLRANGDQVDIVSIHRYPFPKERGEGPPTPDKLLATTREWDRSIPELRNLIRETTGRDLPIAVTEFNSTWANWCCTNTTPDGIYGALWLGDVLGRLIRQRVDVIGQFCLQNASSGLGILGSFDPNPAYYVYQLYKRFGKTLLYASVDDDRLSIYAARQPDGKITLMLLNLSDKETNKPLIITGLAASRDAQVWLLDAKHRASDAGTVRVGRGASLTLAPYSMSLYVVP